MSLYKELNHVNLDLDEFEEETLSKHEQKRIQKKVLGAIRPNRSYTNWIGICASIVAVSILSLSLTFNIGVSSNPFVGEKIETYINQNKELDFSAYKTEVGQRVETEIGTITLNEVMVDYQMVYLAATFEPAEGTEFDYQTHIIPSLKINGQDYTLSTGSQSIEINDQMFTLYNDIEISSPLESDELQIEISYEKWGEESVKEPWSFNVNVTQDKLVTNTDVWMEGAILPLQDGGYITIEKVVGTPLSTVAYYDLSGTNDSDIELVIQSKDGEVEIAPNSSFVADEGQLSNSRFAGESIQGGEFIIFARNFEHEVLSEAFQIQ